jgi:hypothetical protein
MERFDLSSAIGDPIRRAISKKLTSKVLVHERFSFSTNLK